MQDFEVGQFPQNTIAQIFKLQYMFSFTPVGKQQKNERIWLMEVYCLHNMDKSKDAGINKQRRLFFSILQYFLIHWIAKGLCNISYWVIITAPFDSTCIRKANHLHESKFQSYLLPSVIILFHRAPSIPISPTTVYHDWWSHNDF